MILWISQNLLILNSFLIKNEFRSKIFPFQPKHKSLAIDTNDYTKEEELPKEDENARPMCKPCQRSTTRQDSPCSPGKESTSNTEETREDSSYCELAVKDEEQDIPNRKNTYAGGDLNPDFNLRATKSYIIGLIDRVLSKKFATSPGQQKVLLHPEWNTKMNLNYCHFSIFFEFSSYYYYHLLSFSEYRIESRINGARILCGDSTRSSRRLLRIVHEGRVEPSRDTCRMHKAFEKPSVAAHATHSKRV